MNEYQLGLVAGMVPPLRPDIFSYIEPHFESGKAPKSALLSEGIQLSTSTRFGSESGSLTAFMVLPHYCMACVASERPENSDANQEKEKGFPACSDGTR